MKRSRVSGIYAITPETEDTAGLVGKVAAALAGGVRIVQYRNKTGSADLRRAQCGALVERLRDVNGTLIVNDDSRLAVDVDADGVHLGKDDDSLVDARRRLVGRQGGAEGCRGALPARGADPGARGGRRLQKALD